MPEKTPHTPPEPHEADSTGSAAAAAGGNGPEFDEWEKQTRGTEGGPSQWGWGEPAPDAPIDPDPSFTPRAGGSEAPTEVLPPRPEREEIPLDESLSISSQVEKAAAEGRVSLLGLEIKKGSQSLVVRGRDYLYLDLPQLEKKKQLLPRYDYPNVPAKEGFFIAPKKGVVRMLNPSKWSRKPREQTAVNKTLLPRLYHDSWGLALERKPIAVKKVDQSIPTFVVDVIDRDGNLTGIKYLTYGQFKDILDGKSAPGLSEAPVTGLAWTKPKPETLPSARADRIDTQLKGDRDVDVLDQALLQQKERGLQGLGGLTWTKLEKGEDGTYKRFKYQIVQDLLISELTKQGPGQVPAWMVKVTDSKDRVVRREILRVGIGTKGENYGERILKRQLFEAKADTGDKRIRHIIGQHLLPEKKSAALDFFANTRDTHWEIPKKREILAKETLDAHERELYNRYLGWLSTVPLPEFETREEISQREAEHTSLEDFIKRETVGLEKAIDEKVAEEIKGVDEVTFKRETKAMKAKIRGDRRVALWLLSDMDGTGKVDVDAMAELLVNKPESHQRIATLRYIIAEQGLSIVMEQILKMHYALKTDIDKLGLLFDDTGSISWLAATIADQRYSEDNQVRGKQDQLPKRPGGSDPDFVNIFSQGAEAQRKQGLVVAGLLGQIFSSIAVTPRPDVEKLPQVNQLGQQMSRVKVNLQLRREVMSQLPDLVRQPIQRLLQNVINDRGGRFTGDDYVKVGELLEHSIRS